MCLAALSSHFLLLDVVVVVVVVANTFPYLFVRVGPNVRDGCLLLLPNHLDDKSSSSSFFPFIPMRGRKNQYWIIGLATLG